MRTQGSCSNLYIRNKHFHEVHVVRLYPLMFAMGKLNIAVPHLTAKASLHALLQHQQLSGTMKSVYNGHCIARSHLHWQVTESQKVL